MARFVTKTVCTALITVLCAGNVFAQGGTYDIILLANPVTGGVVYGGGTYNDGETATVTAFPDSCYKFLNWTENDIEVSTDAAYTFTVTADRVLTANFGYGRQGYEIIVLANPEDGGIVTGGGAYDCGKEVTVTATPAEGYMFVSWTENGFWVFDASVYTFLATTSHTLVANFEGMTTIGEVETSGITVYPNPTSGELRVESGELRVESVEVFDVFGRNVSRLTSHIAHPISIDLSHLPSGIYFLRIQTENDVVVRKVIKSE